VLATALLSCRKHFPVGALLSHALSHGAGPSLLLSAGTPPASRLARTRDTLYGRGGAAHHLGRVVGIQQRDGDVVDRAPSR